MTHSQACTIRGRDRFRHYRRSRRNVEVRIGPTSGHPPDNTVTSAQGHELTFPSRCELCRFRRVCWNGKRQCVTCVWRALPGTLKLPRGIFTMPKGADERRQNYPHFLSIPTRWSDNDLRGHVNNSRYFEYFDTAVNQYLITA